MCATGPRHGWVWIGDRRAGARTKRETNGRTYVCAWTAGRVRSRAQPPRSSGDRDARCGCTPSRQRVDVAWRRGCARAARGQSREKQTIVGDPGPRRVAGGEGLGEASEEGVRITLCQQSRDGSADDSNRPPSPTNRPLCHPVTPRHTRATTAPYPASACARAGGRPLAVSWRAATAGRTAGGQTWRDRARQGRADGRPREETE